MIGVFKTNIDSQHDKNQVLKALTEQFEASACSVDLEDCDKVLRIVCRQTEENVIALFVQELGYQCTPLD